MGLFTATAARSRRSWRPRPPAPLLPKLRGHVAEFLSEGSPVHLGSVLPVHLRRFAVRTHQRLARGFSCRSGPQTFTTPSPAWLPAHLRAASKGICLLTPPTWANVRCPLRIASAPPRVPPSLKRPWSGAGILTCSPSTTPFGLALGPTSPGWIILPQEPLDFRWHGFSPCFHATHSGIRTWPRSTTPSRMPSPLRPTLPYHSPPDGRPPGGKSAASVAHLSPDTFSAQNHWTSELLRTRSRMAASTPTSWLSGRFHILVHSVHTSGP